MLSGSKKTSNRLDDLSKLWINVGFVLGRVKKDNITLHSPAKVSMSVYHNDFRQRASGL